MRVRILKNVSFEENKQEATTAAPSALPPRGLRFFFAKFALDGELGLAMLHADASSFDLVLLDVVMPGLDGIEVRYSSVQERMLTSLSLIFSCCISVLVLKTQPIAPETHGLRIFFQLVG